MAEWLSGILATSAYLPHGICLAWEPGLVRLQVLSDIVIAISYYSIPAALTYFALERRDLPFQGVFILFVIFILACGTTHALAAVLLWDPVYRLDGLVKALTAAVSMPTAIALWLLLPKALALPSHAQLEAVNRSLSHEIEERRRIEQEVRQLNALLDERVQIRTAQLQSILDTVPDAMIVFDGQGHIESFSATAERMFGYPADEVHGRNLSMLIPSLRRDEPAGSMQRSQADGERHAIGIGRVLTGCRRDTSAFAMELSVGEVHLVDQHLFIGFVRDITDRQESERRQQDLLAQVAHSSRLTEMGQMASALAHELNQPLTASGNYLSAFRRLVERGDAVSLERARAAADSAGIQIQRAGEIIRRLRDFVRKSAPQQRAENIVVLVKEAAELMRFSAQEHGVQIDLDTPSEVPSVLADKVQIQQVVVNILRNAIEAMQESPIREITVRVASPTNGQVTVGVTDTGPGIAQQIAERLFQPFTTSKAQGMGVGLSLCRWIIEAHGGRLWAEPNPCGGTAFQFSLPVATG